jgi:ferritin-like metal-binding protein YciE
MTQNMPEKEKLEEQIGEVLGLEMAAQKTVEELSSIGLLDKGGLKDKLKGMKSEAGDHQRRIEQVMQGVADSEGLDQQRIRQNAEETSQKVAQMLQTYLGEDPDTLDALEFLCLAEGGEVTHYEVLDELAKDVKDKKLASEVKSILAEEKQHLQLCTQLARENSSG